MNIEKIEMSNITPELFNHFSRHQQVTHCWRYSDGQWKIEPVNFTEEWESEEHAQLCSHLKTTLKNGGIVLGAFSDNNQLKGFASVEGQLFGSHKQYLDLSAIHVSEDVRGQKIGRQLFLSAADFAEKQGAEKLYISSHSAVETQAFYSSLGCVDAVEPSTKHTDDEPFDRQLEYRLGEIG
ncbi:GNAT family N-acetyltransferase [Enterococcus sp. BWM-S5]|uniref:GNAT family N-acetyltransferase n=1 Tax=Enterococcus larvae TaxID=2794352 RepID=A0ABS4CF19_9ENTE|nr:GNAT family N-acetyltransferase [Enterococcus larvae]MBP1045019.1 GNAT family N-acetyltransferase [Enterococcus larvae]